MRTPSSAWTSPRSTSVVAALLSRRVVGIEPGVTTMTVVATPKSAAFGDDVTISATLGSSSTVALTGSLVFSEAGKTLDTVPLDRTSASLRLSGLGGGAHTIDVTCAGDDNHEACNGSVTLTIDKAPSTMVLTSSGAATVVGQLLRLNATVTTTDGTATGTVTFRDGATTLGTAKLSDGAATLDIDSLAVGALLVRRRRAA